MNNYELIFYRKIPEIFIFNKIINIEEKIEEVFLFQSINLVNIYLKNIKLKE